MKFLRGALHWTGKGIVLFAVLSWLVLGLVTAAPARGMEQPGRAPQPETGAPAIVTGAPAVLGVDDGDAVAGDAAALTLAVGSGASWVRVLVHWYLLEPTQGAYDFSSSDAAINDLVNAGLAPLVVLVDNPSWAANTFCGPVDTNDPARVQALANMMGALAARYPNVSVWSLFNEIDGASVGGGGCFGAFDGDEVNNNGVPDYREYAIELAAVREAVRSANPNAQVAMGALAMDNFSAGPNNDQCPSNYPGGCVGGFFNYKFASKLFTYIKNNPLPNGAPYMDLALFNYYDIYGRYWETVAAGHGIQAKTNAFRQRMTDAGLAVVPLGVSETGVHSNSSPAMRQPGPAPSVGVSVTGLPSGADSLGLAGQARCVDVNLVRGIAAQLTFINWWTFKDYPDSAPPPKNTWKYGLVDQNLQPKKSYTAFQTMTTELNGYTYIKSAGGKRGFAGVEAYFFKSGAKKKYVVWSASIISTSDFPECSWARSKRNATFKATKLRVVDYMGKVTTIKDNSKRDKDKTAGKIAITVANDPKFVQINP